MVVIIFNFEFESFLFLFPPFFFFLGLLFFLFLPLFFSFELSSDSLVVDKFSDQLLFLVFEFVVTFEILCQECDWELGFGIVNLCKALGDDV